MKDHYTAIEVQALVREMDHSKTRWRKLRGSKPDEYRAKLQAENKVLYDAFPSLFEMHADDKLDETFFRMLQLKRQIERGELTQEQASAAMGQQLFQRYVKPTVDASTPAPPKPMSYEDYYRQFQG